MNKHQWKLPGKTNKQANKNAPKSLTVKFALKWFLTKVSGTTCSCVLETETPNV